MEAGGQRGQALALYVAPSGDRWDVRFGPELEPAFTYGNAGAALEIARHAACNHWRKWGFPCSVYTRDGDGQDWRLDSRFGPGADAYGTPADA